MHRRFLNLSDTHLFQNMIWIKFFSTLHYTTQLYNTLDPNATTIIAPEIVRLSSYLSYQRRKSSGALAVTNQKKSAAKLAQDDFPLAEIKSHSSSKKSKTDNEEYCSNNSCLCPKKESSEEDLSQWTKCPKSKCPLQFCPKCATESDEHALVCRQPTV